MAELDGAISALEMLELSHKASRIVFAWTPYASLARSKVARNGLKLKLAALLWKTGVQMLYTGRSAEKADQSALRLGTDRLGKPYVRLNDAPGPAVSFAHGPESLWACMGFGEVSVGIDIASAADFESDYPYGRVFARNELTEGLAREAGGKSEAAALLWSAKEAVVKALGCGFHLVSPHEVTLTPRKALPTGRGFSVSLADRVRSRFGEFAKANWDVRCLRQRGSWVSVAALDQHPETQLFPKRIDGTYLEVMPS
jgi:hypothetical protein